MTKVRNSGQTEGVGEWAQADDGGGLEKGFLRGVGEEAVVWISSAMDCGVAVTRGL